MKRRNDHDTQTLDDLLSSHKAPPADEMRASIELVAARLRTGAGDSLSEFVSKLEKRPRAWLAPASATHARSILPSWRWLQVAAVILVVVAAEMAVVRRQVDNALFRVVEGDVYQGETIRSNGGGGAVLELSDTSRIEMRSHSELSFERAKDGIRIVLSRGGIVVNAAKQRTGHLYVQTKDMTVSVIGTVFVVNADEAGSRVAVVEGEVRVQQGNTQTKLRSGEGLASSPNRETFSVASELAWSRRAAALAALMNQAGADSPAVTRVVADEQVARAEAPRRFEVATIRRVPAPGGGGGRRGGSGGPAGPAAGAPPCLAGGPLGRPLEVDPSRFAASGVTLRFLVLLAYGGDCRYLSGGPDWMASERYDVEARIPAGAATYTREQLRAGKAPQLQEMLRQLLAERFALSVRLEPREAPVYHLVVVQEGRMKPADGAPSPAGAPLSTPSGRGGLVLPPGQVPAPGTAIMTLRGTTDGVATALSGLVDRPVVNRTNLSGLFQVWLEWDNGMRDHGAVDPDPRFANNAMIFQALQNQLGLKLEPATGVMEAIVIERAAPPTDN